MRICASLSVRHRPLSLKQVLSLQILSKLVGKIAIKNKWYGENLLILVPDFNFEEWVLEADLLISSGKAKYCLGGWVDVFQDNYQVQLYLVEAAGIKMKLTSI